jgi:glycosyltransferase involved in cell wall biosynthesis
LKILLTMNLPYTRVHGGTNRSNRSLCEELAARQNAVQIVVPALSTPSRITHSQFLQELRSEQIEVTSGEHGDVFMLNGVEVHTVRESGQLRAYLIKQLRQFSPDWALVSSEDPSQNLLSAALKTCPGRVIYLAHTPQLFPFGPASLHPGKTRANLIGHAAAIISISHFVADYIKRWTDLNAFVNHPPHYGAGPFPDLSCYEQGYVLLMNACPIKGLPIFLGLARALPEVKFAALAGYGTTTSDLASLASLPNVTLLKNEKKLDDIFRQTRVLLMPTLWLEGFGMAVVDAMLRGIPVLASNFGGLVEAKLGTDYLLPVNPIERFADQFDENRLPLPLVPPQDIAPWQDALEGLLSHRALYEKQALAAREASIAFVSRLSVEPLEDLLMHLPQGAQNGQRQLPSRPSNPSLESAVPKMSKLFESVAGLTPEHRALLMLRLRNRALTRGQGSLTAPPIERIPRDRPLPLSFAQHRLWFLDQLEPSGHFYNLPFAVRLLGELDVAAIEHAFSELVKRHESLRTSFAATEGEPVQIIAPPTQLCLPFINLSLLAPHRREEEIVRLAHREALQPFDLAYGPLFRVRLLRLAEAEHIILFSMHHIIADGWSMQIILREVALLYNAYCDGQPSPLPSVPIQYADFAYWQRHWLRGPILEEQLCFWKRQMANAPALLALPTDKPRPPVQSFAGAHQSFVLHADLTAQLKALSQQEGVTFFMFILAAFKVLLSCYSGHKDIIVGTPIAGRTQLETESLIGFFVNMLILRTDFSAATTFREVVRRVRAVSLGAYAHQDMPFEKIVEQLQPERVLGHNSLFQVTFSLQSASRETIELKNLTLSQIGADTGTAQFDLILNMADTQAGLRGTLVYSTELFVAATIARMIRHFEELLKVIVERPAVKLDELQEAFAVYDKQHQRTAEKELDELSSLKLKKARRKTVGATSAQVQ